MGMMASRATRVREANEEYSDPTANDKRLADRAPAMAAMNDEMQNTSTLVTLTVVPSVSSGQGRVATWRQHRPSRDRMMATMVSAASTAKNRMT